MCLWLLICAFFIEMEYSASTATCPLGCIHHNPSSRNHICDIPLAIFIDSSSQDYRCNPAGLHSYQSSGGPFKGDQTHLSLKILFRCSGHTKHALPYGKFLSSSDCLLSDAAVESILQRFSDEWLVSCSSQLQFGVDAATNRVSSQQYKDNSDNFL